jgi:hypothetical protein
VAWLICNNPSPVAVPQGVRTGLLVSTSPRIREQTEGMDVELVEI